MQNSITMWTFSILDQKYPFLEKFGLKIQNCLGEIWYPD